MDLPLLSFTSLVELLPQFHPFLFTIRNEFSVCSFPIVGDLIPPSKPLQTLSFLLGTPPPFYQVVKIFHSLNLWCKWSPSLSPAPVREGLFP